MIEQVGNSVTFLAQFLASGAAATGLTVTVDVYRVSDESLLVNDAAANEVGASGVYKYTYGPAATEDDYLAVFHTAGTADQVDVPSLWTVGHAGVENLDALISSRLATAGYTVPPTAAAVADAVTDELVADHQTAGSVGYKLSLIGAASVTITAPVGSDGVLSLTRGDDYKFAQSRHLTFTSAAWPNLTGLGSTACILTIRRRAEAFGSGSDPVILTAHDVVASRVLGAGTQTLVFELPSTAVVGETGTTNALLVGTATGKYDVQVTMPTSSNIVTLATGTVTVVEDQTRP